MLKPIRTLLQATLAVTVLASVAACGAAPNAAALRQGAMAARAAMPGEPFGLAIGSLWGWSFDMPKPNHPFASPLKYRISARAEGRVVEMLAPGSDRPTRGMAMIPLEDEDAASFYETDDNEKKKLAKRVKVSYRWGVNMADGVKDTALPAQVVFFVDYLTGDKDGENEVTKTIAIGYVWSSKGLKAKDPANAADPGLLREGQIYPPLNERPQRIATGEGEYVDFRFVPRSFGYGFNKPCGEAALATMPFETVTIDSLVRDVQTAFPETLPPKTAAEGLPGNMAAPSLDENRRLVGIRMVGFGASVPANTCAQAILGTGLALERTF